MIIENMHPVPAEPGAITVRFDATILGTRFENCELRDANGVVSVRPLRGPPVDWPAETYPEFVAAAKRAYAALSTWTRIH